MLRPPERLPERDAAITAMLAHVPFDGWTQRALRRGLADIGAPADDAELLFPGGAADMVACFCDLTDRRMELAAAAMDMTDMRLPRRVRAVIALRLEQNGPHKEAVRRALAVLALRGQAAAAAACTARTVDAIWHAAGDTSADFSWYTKRAILASVYTSPRCCSGCAIPARRMPRRWISWTAGLPLWEVSANSASAPKLRWNASCRRHSAAPEPACPRSRSFIPRNTATFGRSASRRTA